MTRIVGAALVLTLASACAAVGGAPSTSETPRRDLAVRPSSLPPTTGVPTSTSSANPVGQRSGSTGPGTTGGSTPGSTGPGSTPGSSGNGSASTAPFRTFLTMTDPSGDAGLGAPPYADLVSVTLADNGTSLRATVVMNGALPAQTATGETMGIGVDLYRAAAGRESDYQLFADGESDGWYAYLDTPKGYIRFPGTFALGGRTLVFTVPWASVGNPRTGRTSAFADWSQRSSAPTGNPSSNDFVPTIGTTNYSR